jgi:hypothetical protein
MTSIREDEWRAELERLAEASRSRADAGLTGPEWAAKLGRCLPWTRNLLREAKRLGLLVTGSKTIVRLDGRPTTVAVYSVRPSASGRTRKAARRSKGVRSSRSGT